MAGAPRAGRRSRRASYGAKAPGAYCAARGCARDRLDLVAEARRQWRAHGWVGPDRGMAAVISLMRAQQIVLGRLEDVVRPFGLSYARYEVLMLLSFSRSGVLPLARIGERLQVHPASRHRRGRQARGAGAARARAAPRRPPGGPRPASPTRAGASRRRRRRR